MMKNMAKMMKKKMKVTKEKVKVNVIASETNKKRGLSREIFSNETNT